MLNLQIAMFLLTLSLLITSWFAPFQQNTAGPILDLPMPGQAVQGVVIISGTTQVDQFASAQVEFRYEDDPLQTWFLIQDNIPAIQNDVLTSWDTTTITDGSYHLRLNVRKTDGTSISVEVTGVRVRNYSIIETNTPDRAPVETLQSSPSPTLSPVIALSTPTPQPPNPVAITTFDLRNSAGRGLFIVLAAFLIFGIYFGLSRLRRR
jgi:hypothetical protein